MNKYQKALNNLVYCKSEIKCKECRHKSICTMERDSKVLQELIDKEKPMKPIVYNINQYKCPKCSKQIKGKKMIYNMETKRFDIKSKIKVEKVYCPYCGQKLDWSDTDE